MSFAYHKLNITTPVHEDAETGSRLFKEPVSRFKQQVSITPGV